MVFALFEYNKTSNSQIYQRSPNQTKVDIFDRLQMTFTLYYAVFCQLGVNECVLIRTLSNLIKII